MFFIKRKKAKPIEKETAEEIAVSNQDKVVLGGFCFTGMQKGNFFVKDRAIIDPTATIDGSITATDCTIGGLVKGNVFCTNTIQISSSAVIEGSIMAKKAIMETGCRINGSVSFTPKVEVSMLAIKLIEAEKIIGDKKISKARELLTEETNIPQKSSPIPGAKAVDKEQKKINTQKPESAIAQSVDNGNNWW